LSWLGSALDTTCCWSGVLGYREALKVELRLHHL